jgi:hypothetical protein
MRASAFLPGAARGEHQAVRAVTLQTALERCGSRIALLKLDCEGAEADIIAAAGPALESIDRIVAEYHSDLVPDVIPRMRRALDGAFSVTVSAGKRCGPMLRAVRR